MTSVKEIKERLKAFLDDPDLEQEFRDWFALALRDVHKSNDPTAEALAHEIVWAFHDQRRGLCSPRQLMDELTRLATDPGVHFGAEPFQVKADATSTSLLEVPAIVLGTVQVGVERALVYG